MSRLRIVALGGLDENGNNMYSIEIDNRIIIVNTGIKYPEDTQFGVQYITPDLEYLKVNRNKIAAVVITHAHDDMMNGLPIFLKEIKVPVYGPRMCRVILKNLMPSSDYNKVDFHEIDRNSEYVIDGIRLTTFGLTHSTPDALGLAIETENGEIVIAEQFVIDFNSHDRAFDCDVSRIAEIGKKNVLALLMEASYADKPDFTSPKHRISNLIRTTFEDAQGRIVVTVYDQNYIRIKEIIAMAREFRRSVFFYDDELRNNIEALSELGYYTMPRGIEIPKSKFNNDIKNIVIIVSGSGHKLFELMNRIATDEDDILDLTEEDTVIIASPIVPGLEKKASALEDELYKDGAHVVKLDSKTVLSAHPSTEDIKMMLSLLKPKYFIPTMGEYRNFISAANLALEIGYTPDRIIILDNGQIAYFNDGILLSCSDFIDVGENMVGDENNKQITSFVLRDRETLSTDGVIIIGIAINYNTKEVIAGPDIQSRGVIYVKDSEYVIKNIGKMAVELIEQHVAEGTYDNMAIRAELRENASRYVLRETGKRPMILPAIIEINLPAR
ncbi:MAG: ribonuclease J [Erysipelotrichaceae bacterium]|nr:ribonuclease J [Erysipelotrichaceae bacterium]